MLPEAELFVRAEDMLVEVLGRIRPADHDIVLPPMHGDADEPQSMASAVAQHLRDEADLTRALGGADPAEQGVAGAAERACAAAALVTDGALVVPTAQGELPVRELLLRATVTRSLLAHYVAAYLGSTACPLPEELARPLHEATAADAAAWRALGHFRPPMPLPPHVSWRDRFLLTAGHEPHPLGH